jgi:hypothetical protein
VYPEPQGAANVIVHADGGVEMFSYYEVTHTPGVIRPMLANGCGPLLSPEFRGQLAESQERFFLKTHEPPFEAYWPGEYVVHLVREPGAVFWSYYNYLRKNEIRHAESLTLDAVIAGQVPLGSWSEHSRAWLATRAAMEQRFLLCSYEELSEQETRVCDIIAGFSGLSYPKNIKPLPPLEHWHKQAPNLYRKQPVAEWGSHFSAEQLDRIAKDHGGVMRQLGYDTGKYQGHRSTEFEA